MVSPRTLGKWFNSTKIFQRVFFHRQLVHHMLPNWNGNQRPVTLGFVSPWLMVLDGAKNPLLIRMVCRWWDSIHVNRCICISIMRYVQYIFIDIYILQIYYVFIHLKVHVFRLLAYRFLRFVDFVHTQRWLNQPLFHARPGGAVDFNPRCQPLWPHLGRLRKGWTMGNGFGSP